MATRMFSTEQLRDFVIAGHWNLPKVRELLAKFPALLNAPYQWAENDLETAIQAAAHAGSPQVADFLLSHGAPLSICTAAMLGQQNEVKNMLGEAPELIHAHGAHGIPLMPHAALSGNIALMEMLYEMGAREGISFALSNAVNKSHISVAQWLLEHSNPDPKWKNYEGKNAMTIASERGDMSMLALLRGHNAG